MNMKCTVCGQELVAGELKLYETLCEHVTDPNGPGVEKPTLVCQNPVCLTFGRGFWSVDEGAFYPDDSDGIKVVNVPDLGPEINRKGPPKLELAFELIWAKRLLGESPIWRQPVFERLKKLIDTAICPKCKGSGWIKIEEENYSEKCQNCKGTCVCIG